MRAICLLLLGAFAAFGSRAPAAGQGAEGPIPVVAAVNTWGSVVAEIGGPRVQVRSLVTDPNADPHEYESNASAARAIADARFVVVNGAGYDAWADKLLAAGGRPDRVVLHADAVVGARPGDNPHLWYAPAYVARVAQRIAADLERIDPAGRAGYEARLRAFMAACAPYRNVLAAIRRRRAGTPVGASEDIAVYLAQDAGLRLTTPPAFMRAVAGATEPPADAVIAFHRQIDARAIAVLLNNTQTATAVTDDIRRLARARGIPVVDLTETIVPTNVRFEDWQLAEVRRLQAALGR